MLTFNEALNNYYTLKTKYETTQFENKKKIIQNEGLSWPEKRREYKKIKSKCVNCERPVGTIFSSKFQEDQGCRILSAICGDRVKPCNLNIRLKNDNVDLLENLIKREEDDIKQIKNEIIKEKNNLLFGYTTQEIVLEKFETTSKKLNNAYSLLNSYLEMYLNVTDNKQKQDELTRSIIESYVVINNIKSNIRQFNLDNNFQLINDSVNNDYIAVLTPKLVKIRNFKNMVNTVDYNNNIYKLIQQKYSIEGLEEFNMSEVLNYDFGKIVSTTTTNNKTRKRNDKENVVKPIKNKTQKLIIESTSSD
jgi:hypothetical protein